MVWFPPLDLNRKFGQKNGPNQREDFSFFFWFSPKSEQKNALHLSDFFLVFMFFVFIFTSKDGSTVRYASIFAKKYGTLVWHAFFVKVRYVGTVRPCNGTGTVRWYAI